MKILRAAIRILFLGLFLFLVTNGKMVIWLALFAVSLAAAVFFGRIYCGYVCPMNTVMIPAAWLSKKLGLQTASVPKWLRSGKIAWIGLGASVLLTLILKRAARIDIPVLLIWLVIAVLVTVRYKPAVFHNLLCPFGPLQKIAGRKAAHSEKVSRDACTGCGKCVKVCPSDAVKVGSDRKAGIETALCHQCGSCSRICPVNAVKYTGKP